MSARRRELKYAIPAGSVPRHCRGNGCTALIYFVRTEHRAMPVNADGTPHWATCPASMEFRTLERLERRLAELQADERARRIP